MKTIKHFMSQKKTSIYHILKELKYLFLGKGVQNIAKKAFSQWSSLLEVHNGSSIQSIGEFAFSFCSNLVKVTIDVNLTAIGDFVFSSCLHLSTVIIKSNVQTVCEHAFFNCLELNDKFKFDGLNALGISYSATNLPSALGSLRPPPQKGKIKSRRSIWLHLRRSRCKQFCWSSRNGKYCGNPFADDFREQVCYNFVK